VVKEAVEEALALLDAGQARVAEKKDGRWVVNEWLKKAVLLSFRLEDNVVMEGGFTRFYDKVPPKPAVSPRRAPAWCRRPPCAGAATSPPGWCSCPPT